MSGLRPGQTLVDLGAGDDRIVLIAARQLGAQAIGVEIDPIRCWVAKGLTRLLGVQGQARVVHGNLFDLDLAEADVVTLYLLHGTTQRIKGYLLEQLRPGARLSRILLLSRDGRQCGRTSGGVFICTRSAARVLASVLSSCSDLALSRVNTRCAW